MTLLEVRSICVEQGAADVKVLDQAGYAELERKRFSATCCIFPMTLIGALLRGPADGKHILVTLYSTDAKGDVLRKLREVRGLL